MISKGIAAYLDTHGTISGHWRPGKRQPQPSTVISSEAKDLRLLVFLHQNNNSGCPPSPTAVLSRIGEGGIAFPHTQNTKLQVKAGS